ncbi:two-partner secretion domain-containing protein [Fischerella sp. PCC 9605]|uniref:two-partner secretion domain-containing protein n=1 Tax=Fischerella sp. PCC 9605 TaxID=1173024 RepID=UPI000479C4B1|nr:S-layer family protein [Fischerella sp. PCC 9605]
MTSLRGTRLGCFLGIAIGSVYALFANCALAQITPDRTLPNNSNVTTEGNTFNITGGSQAGSNLFHSFQEFSVPTNSTALFNNATDIQNILTRVTGGSISNIDGLIKANGTANLFLINPNGIIFGQNARLDIGGSFLASTASSLKFADGTDFSATPNITTTPLLSINVPIGLQYGSNTGSIQVQGANLKVTPGKTLALAGGNVGINGGQLLAAGGRVELAGIAEQGNVGLNSNSSNLGLNFPDAELRKDVSISNGAQVNVLAGGGGSIAINAQNLNILGDSTVQAGIDSGKGSVDAKAFDIDINAIEAINVDASQISNTVQPNAIGNSGNINITTGSLALTSGGQLRTTTSGQGNAGNINILVRNTVTFDRMRSDTPTGSYSTVEPKAVGNGGDINITTGSLFIKNAAVVNARSQGQGDAGGINIVARDTVSFDGYSFNLANISGAASSVGSTEVADAVGNGKTINITTGSLFVTNGARLVANTFGRGNAGNVNINARDAVVFDGVGLNGYSSGAVSNVESTGEGKGGNVNITTRSLAIQNGAVLGARTRGKGDGGSIVLNAKTLEAINGGQIFTTSFGSGKAGNITLNISDSITLAGTDPTHFDRVRQYTPVIAPNIGPTSGFFANTSSSSTGQGGEFTINTGKLNIRDRAQLTVSSTGTGIAGSLKVNANSIRLWDQAKISADTRGGAGNITLRSRDLILRRGSSITTNATGSNIIGGNITIDNDVLAASENSDISANSDNFFGGRVVINTKGFFGTQFRPSPTLESDITATGASPELSGTVQINTPDVDPSRGLVQLRANLVDASQQIATGCNGGENQARSSFIVTGRGGIPPSPTEPLIGDGVVTNWITLFDTAEEQQRSRLAERDSADSANPPTQIVEAQGWVVDANGEVILVDAAPTVALHNPLFQPVSCSAIEPR